MKMRGAGHLLGFIVHLVVSAMVGFIYVGFFALIGAETNLWAWGLLGGAIHWAVAARSSCR